MYVANQDRSIFTQYNRDWHKDLANLLLKADFEMLLKLPLIPLKGPKGEWISTKDLKTRHVFTEPKSKKTYIPSELESEFVPTTATRVLGLMQRLGVDNWRRVDSWRDVDSCDKATAGTTDEITVRRNQRLD